VESPSPIPEQFKLLRCVSCHVDSRQQAAQGFSRQLRQGREDDLPSRPRRKPPTFKQNEPRTTDRDGPGEAQNKYRALN
jgi:hypothetical protein